MKLRNCLIIFGALFLINTGFEKAQAFQSQKPDLQNLRRLFTEAVRQDFEIVRDGIKNRLQDTVSSYWLVHVKPRRSGYYTLKYTYKFIKSPNNHPEEGENEMRIAVGEKICYRRNVPQSGIANFCLGNTIIIPIRANNLTSHVFSLTRHELKAENYQKAQKEFNSYERYAPVEPVYNQLETNIKFLGISRIDKPHRNCCPVTYEYYAVFEAIKSGKFNLGLSSLRDNEMPDKSLKMTAKSGTPIIIVEPGTPITGLVSAENTIHYSDHKRFSAHAGNNFSTNLLILQPGDVFKLKYAGLTIDYGFAGKSKEREIADLKPAIYKLPFALDKDWSFNDWIADHLPKE